MNICTYNMIGFKLSDEVVGDIHRNKARNLIRAKLGNVETSLYTERCAHIM